MAEKMTADIGFEKQIWDDLYSTDIVAIKADGSTGRLKFASQRTLKYHKPDIWKGFNLLLYHQETRTSQKTGHKDKSINRQRLKEKGGII